MPPRPHDPCAARTPVPAVGQLPDLRASLPPLSWRVDLRFPISPTDYSGVSCRPVVVTIPIVTSHRSYRPVKWARMGLQMPELTVGRRRWSRLVALLATAALVAGCLPQRPGDEPTSAAPTSGVPTTGASTTAPSSTAPGTPVPTTTVASKPVDWAGQDARLEVYTLRRSGEVLVLDFGLRNLGDGDIGIGSEFGKGKDDEDVSGVYLYDAESRTQHWPATTSGECVCTTGLGGVGPGEVQLLTATYGPPDGDVDELDVHVPAVGTLTDVPIAD